jgi:hypothetical protein
MSTDWDIYCLDCESEHGFDDANHQDKLMRELARLGPTIKTMCELMAPLDDLGRPPLNFYSEPRIQLDDGGRLRFNTKWWVQHGDHKLVARDEYGHCDDECGEHYKCNSCGSWKTCRRTKNHDGDHAEKRDDKGDNP